jgi:hypothetical protein
MLTSVLLDFVQVDLFDMWESSLSESEHFAFLFCALLKLGLGMVLALQRSRLLSSMLARSLLFLIHVQLNANIQKNDG